MMLPSSARRNCSWNEAEPGALFLPTADQVARTEREVGEVRAGSGTPAGAEGQMVCN